jgi:hypothetical protein
MINDDDEISEGLNQIFEIINAKGDEGELQEIVNNAEINKKHNQKFDEGK